MFEKSTIIHNTFIIHTKYKSFARAGLDVLNRDVVATGGLIGDDEGERVSFEERKNPVIGG